jgi:eukaryotic-like serine/threonine-protein kinase
MPGRISAPQELSELADLLKQGLLTKDEFEEQKQLILARSRADSSPETVPMPGNIRVMEDGSARGTIGAYAITSQLGVGAMGTVYLGRHSVEAKAMAQGGDVAVKMMHPHYATNPQFRKRFRREAELGFRLAHPGIVKVLDFVVEGSSAALVMEFCEGRVLSLVAGRGHGPLPWRRAFLVMQQLLEALSYAHELGVVHRDLKPQNVLVARDGSLKILDFGVAKDLEGSSAETGTGVAIGTVTYMAPEQYMDARSVTATADLYAAALIFFELLTGRMPWAAGVVSVGILGAKLHRVMPSVREFEPTVPKGFDDLIARALLLKPEDRQQSALAMLDALRTEVWAAELDLGPGEQPPESGHYWWDEELPFPEVSEELTLDPSAVEGATQLSPPDSLTADASPEDERPAVPLGTDPTLVLPDDKAPEGGANRPSGRSRRAPLAAVAALAVVLSLWWLTSGANAPVEPAAAEDPDAGFLSASGEGLEIVEEDDRGGAIGAEEPADSAVDPEEPLLDVEPPAQTVEVADASAAPAATLREEASREGEPSLEDPSAAEEAAAEEPAPQEPTAAEATAPEPPVVEPSEPEPTPVVPLTLRHSPPKTVADLGEIVGFEALLQGTEGECSVH